jgi:hypothetical protein
MKKIFFASLSGLILLVVLAGVVWVAGARQNVSASEPQPQFEDVLPPPIVVVLETDEENPEKSDEILREIEKLSLLENTDGHFIKPGWLFHSYKVEYLGGSDNFVQDDFSIPTEYTMELWFLIGDNERVGSAVTFMKDKAGNVIQTAVFHDGVWRNLTVKDSDYKQEPFEPGWDLDLQTGPGNTPKISVGRKRKNFSFTHCLCRLQFHTTRRKRPAALGSNFRKRISTKTAEVYSKWKHTTSCLMEKKVYLKCLLFWL